MILRAEYKILNEPLNTSTHSPVYLRLSISSSLAPKVTSQPAVKKKRFLWAKADLESYNNIMQECLNTDVAVSDPDLAMQYLTKCLHLAANLAVPTTTPKVKKAPYNPQIAALLTSARNAFFAWVSLGRPPRPHPVSEERKSANKKLRAAQRTQVAIDRSKHLETLHLASSTNSRLLFSIIKEQRSKTTTVTNELIVENKVYTGDLLPAWKEHFSKLAQPSDNPNFVSERINAATKNINMIRDLLPQVNRLEPPLELCEVLTSIRSLKKKKAADVYGLKAEHITSAITPISNFLTPVYSKIIETGQYPVSLKEGVRHPIPKKDKIITIPGNYRGISISAILGKILDKIHLDHQKLSTDARKFHPLQFGFQEGRSCTQAAFIISESIADCKDNKVALYIASIDVQKAFDVVRHESLLDRLYQFGLSGAWWRLKDSAYKDLRERITWKGVLSEAFYIKVGSKQGALPSPDEYVTHIATALFMAANSGMGFSIGNIILTNPTCADDMILMSTSLLQLQALLELITTYANEEQYVIHPQKTVITPFNVASKGQMEFLKSYPLFETNGNTIPVVEEFTHLGIQRSVTSPYVVVEARAETARKTFYALLGAGLHGLNGLPVTTSLMLYRIYVIPRLLYGLESVRLTDTAISKLDSFHRYALRCILGLPKYTATPALFILSGQLPISYQIDIKILSFIRSLLSIEPTRELLLHQYAIKTDKSNSLVVIFAKKLSKYDLPTIYDLYMDTPPKQVWKTLVKSAVIKVACNDIRDGAECKSTLSLLHHQLVFSAPHPAVSMVDNPRQVVRACIKSKILTQTYPIESTRVRIKKAIDPTCPLCHRAPEDTEHFVELCPALEEIRSKFCILWQALPEGPSKIKYILDTRTLAELHPDASEPTLKCWEQLSRDYLFAIHIKRTSLIAIKPDTHNPKLISTNWQTSGEGRLVAARPGPRKDGTSSKK